MENITIYTQSGFIGNVVKHEGKLVDMGFKNYAQFKSVPFVHFIPKGKRKTIGFVKGYRPYMVIVKGHNHPDMPELFGKPIQGNIEGVTIKKTNHSSFSDNWLIDADKIIDVLIEKNPEIVLMDCRNREYVSQ